MEFYNKVKSQQDQPDQGELKVSVFTEDGTPKEQGIFPPLHWLIQITAEHYAIAHGCFNVIFADHTVVTVCIHIRGTPLRACEAGAIG